MRREISSSSSQVASATSISTGATRRSSVHRQNSKGNVLLNTYERLNKPLATPNRRRKWDEFLKPTSAKPVQNRTHSKPTTIHVNKRKGRSIIQKSITGCNKLSSRIFELIARRGPTECPECLKSCKRSDHVRSHIRLKHPELALFLDETYCEKCGKRSTRPVFRTLAASILLDLDYLNSSMRSFSKSTGGSLASLRAVLGRSVYVDFSHSTYENNTTRSWDSLWIRTWAWFLKKVRRLDNWRMQGRLSPCSLYWIMPSRATVWIRWGSFRFPSGITDQNIDSLHFDILDPGHLPQKQIADLHEHSHQKAFSHIFQSGYLAYLNSDLDKRREISRWCGRQPTWPSIRPTGVFVIQLALTSLKITVVVTKHHICLSSFFLHASTAFSHLWLLNRTSWRRAVNHRCGHSSRLQATFRYPRVSTMVQFDRWRRSQI